MALAPGPTSSCPLMPTTDTSGPLLLGCPVQQAPYPWLAAALCPEPRHGPALGTYPMLTAWTAPRGLWDGSIQGGGWHGQAHILAWDAGCGNGEGAGEQAGMARWEGARETQAHWGTLSTLGEALTQRQVGSCGLFLLGVSEGFSGSGGRCRPGVANPYADHRLPKRLSSLWPLTWPLFLQQVPPPPGTSPRGHFSRPCLPTFQGP